jgi:uncharacterized repeat protein (TIGR04042 family)
MPAMHFTVRWPDGSKEECYSPSTVIEKHFSIDHAYTVQEFVLKAKHALDEASQRVAAKFGYACSSALDQAAAIEHTAQRFAAGDLVVIEEISVIEK